MAFYRPNLWRYIQQISLWSFYTLFATIISAPVCLIAEGNWSAFRLRPDIALAAIIFSVRYVYYKIIIWLLKMSNFHSFIYQGTGFSIGVVVHTWGLHLKGPVYVSIFKPLSIAIAAAMSFIFLGDALYLGRYTILSHSSKWMCMHEKYTHDISPLLNTKTLKYFGSTKK